MDLPNCQKVILTYALFENIDREEWGEDDPEEDDDDDDEDTVVIEDEGLQG